MLVYHVFFNTENHYVKLNLSFRQTTYGFIIDYWEVGRTQMTFTIFYSWEMWKYCILLYGLISL